MGTAPVSSFLYSFKTINKSEMWDKIAEMFLGGISKNQNRNRNREPPVSKRGKEKLPQSLRRKNHSSDFQTSIHFLAKVLEPLFSSPAAVLLDPDKLFFFFY